jgi:phage gp46-like protein
LPVVKHHFTDKRIQSDQDSPPNEKDKGGWWADETLENNDFIGSLLWTLKRKNITSMI